MVFSHTLPSLPSWKTTQYHRGIIQNISALQLLYLSYWPPFQSLIWWQWCRMKELNYFVSLILCHCYIWYRKPVKYCKVGWQCCRKNWSFTVLQSICKQSLDILSEDIVRLSLSILGSVVENQVQHILKIQEVDLEMKDWWCITGLQAGDKGRALACSGNGTLACKRLFKLLWFLPLLGHNIILRWNI